MRELAEYMNLRLLSSYSMFISSSADYWTAMLVYVSNSLLVERRNIWTSRPPLPLWPSP